MTRTVENKNVVAVNEGVKTMENKEQQFNALAWVKSNILQAYYNALANKEIPEDGVYEVTMNGYFQSGIFWYLNKFQALKVVSYRTEHFTNEAGENKVRHTVYIKDLNIEAKARKKTETGYDGEEYDIFTNAQKRKAKAKVLDALVA